MRNILKSKYRFKPHSGTGHFIHQRLTALALIPLSIWFTVSMIKVLQNPTHYLPKYVESLLNVIFLSLILVMAIYHGALGIKVIIDDYIHNNNRKKATVFMLYLISTITLIVGLITLILTYINHKMG